MAEATLASLGTVTDDKLLELVRLSENSERYEDMCKFIKKLVASKSSQGKDLDVEERNLLSVAYKNVVGQKRAAWRTLNGDFEEIDAQLTEKYKKLVEDELEGVCKDVLDILTNYLLKTVKGHNDETEVFYYKMAGDYYRYLAEFRETDDVKNNAKEFYSKAMDIATASLPETHPTRLGLALNFSVCYYEILKEPEKACELAKKAFDSGIAKLDTLSDASYKDSTLIMQLLRDNLTLWTSEQEANDNDNQQED